MVVDVQRPSRAWAMGLRSGDVIVGFNRHPIRSLADFKAAVTSAAEGSVALSVRRGDAEFLIFAS